MFPVKLPDCVFHGQDQAHLVDVIPRGLVILDQFLVVFFILATREEK